MFFCLHVPRRLPRITFLGDGWFVALITGYDLFASLPLLSFPRTRVPAFLVCLPSWSMTQIPIAVVVTKIDICPPTVLKQTRQALAKYLRQNQKMPYPIKEPSQVSI